MDRYKEPKNFEELVYWMNHMEDDEYVTNEDTGHFRSVEIVNMYNGKYGLYEDDDFVGCTHDVVAAAQFIAEGWEAYTERSN